MRFVSAIVPLGGVLLTVATACETPQLVGDPKAPEGPGSAFKETSGVQCSSVRPQTEPDLMAWDPGSRANLARLRQEGMVAVRYAAQGCNVELELLPNCIGQGASYTFSPYAETQTKIAHNAQELYAELPLGAAKLTGKLEGSKSIRTDYMLVGTATLPAGRSVYRSDLHGQGCERATHVVSAVYLGGFAMMAGETAKLQASGSLFMVSAGGDSHSEGERLDSAGDPEACAKAAKNATASAQCAVPLRVGLLALQENEATAALRPLNRTPVSPTPAPEAAPTDQDGDGVIDSLDRCPTVAGPAAAGGCPVLFPLKFVTGEATYTPAIQFASGRGEILSGTDKLDTIATAMMQGHLRGKLEISVHTDNLGSAAANQALTDERARAILGYFMRKFPLLVMRVTAKGWGMDRPIADNTTLEGRASNRRVEMLLVK